MNRKQKIDFLIGIANGELSLNDLEPKEINEWYYDDKTDTYFQNINSEVITGKEFRERYKPSKRTPKRFLIGMDAI